MATKTRTSRVASKKAAPVNAAPVRIVRVHVHPRKAEFVNADGSVEERVPNGSRDSDSFASLVARLIGERDSGATVALRYFNAQGVETSREASQFADLLS